MFDAIRDNPQRERRSFGTSFRIGPAIAEDTRQPWYFRQPAAVVLAFDLNAQHMQQNSRADWYTQAGRAHAAAWTRQPRVTWADIASQRPFCFCQTSV